MSLLDYVSCLSFNLALFLLIGRHGSCDLCVSGEAGSTERQKGRVEAEGVRAGGTTGAVKEGTQVGQVTGQTGHTGQLGKHDKQYKQDTQDSWAGVAYRRCGTDWTDKTDT